MRGARLLASAALLAAAPAAAAPWQLPGSDVVSVEAPGGETYRVLVAWPDGPAPAEGWPVLWLLDGEDHFAAAAQTARRLARGRGAPDVGAGLVLGIDAGPLSRRVFDYTPQIGQETISEGFPAQGLKPGGVGTFLAFLHDRVRLVIADRWPIDESRQTIAGHSFGGLAVLHDLRTVGGFNAYAAISPSLWFSDETERAKGRGSDSVELLLAVGTEEGGPSGNSVAAARDYAARAREQGVSTTVLILPGAAHGDTMLHAMGAIVRLAFEAAGDEGRTQK